MLTVILTFPDAARAARSMATMWAKLRLLGLRFDLAIFAVSY